LWLIRHSGVHVRRPHVTPARRRSRPDCTDERSDCTDERHHCTDNRQSDRTDPLNRNRPTPNSPNVQFPSPNSQLPTSNSQLPTPKRQCPTSNAQLPNRNARHPTPNAHFHSNTVVRRPVGHRALRLLYSWMGLTGIRGNRSIFGSVCSNSACWSSAYRNFFKLAARGRGTFLPATQVRDVGWSQLRRSARWVEPARQHRQEEDHASRVEGIEMAPAPDPGGRLSHPRT
jgi:hypothetical protein